MKIILFLFFVSIVELYFGQEIRFRDHRVDVTVYNVQLELEEQTDTIRVVERIQFNYLGSSDTLVFDLAGLNVNGDGMLVQTVRFKTTTIDFFQKEDLLFVSGINTHSINGIGDFIEIEMKGKPIDGLVIGKNKFNDRTFFGDNWPNRAHNWFACNDYPSDKASIQFSVITPENYEVIANGTLINVNDFVPGQRIWNYQSDYVLPTKVMVVGVADFKVTEFGPLNSAGTPVSAWVYPKDEEKGNFDMILATDILGWFEKTIAPYPFDKLANVQSTTRYGGMENASCIFYDEKAIDGKRSMENLIAHEIAHQWFGNSASEKDFSHLWLSEGFATYLTNVYILETKGEEAFYKQMDKDRAKVVGFDRKISLPVIDTLTTDLNQLLNANAYQKGSWILHMLRMKLGDEVFWKAVRNYYSAFEYSNADSKDLEKIFESTCDCDLTSFFYQWLRIAGNPEIQLKVKPKRRSTVVVLEQLQDETFQFELELEFFGENGHSQAELFHVTKKISKTKFTLPFRVIDYKIDPKRKVLISVK
jgi:aminopeptidase N